MSLSKDEKKAWKKYKTQNKLPKLTPEQTLIWLDGCRELMFEVWKKNPNLQKRFLKLRHQV